MYLHYYSAPNGLPFEVFSRDIITQTQSMNLLIKDLGEPPLTRQLTAKPTKNHRQRKTPADKVARNERHGAAPKRLYEGRDEHAIIR